MAEKSSAHEMQDQHALDALVHGRNGDPFSYLGRHEAAYGLVVRAFFPGARQVDVLARQTGERLGTLACIHGAGVFSGTVSSDVPYTFSIIWPEVVQEVEDPYAFGLLLNEEERSEEQT